MEKCRLWKREEEEKKESGKSGAELKLGAAAVGSIPALATSFSFSLLLFFYFFTTSLEFRHWANLFRSRKMLNFWRCNSVLNVVQPR